jgi:hypothetical protein
MNLRYFSNSFLQRLRAGASGNLSSYGANSAWIETFAAGAHYLLESHQVVGPPPVLEGMAGDAEKYDAENAKRVYEWLGPLSPALAMEERLWAYLTHHAFAEYMAARWPAREEQAIHRRYLFEGKSFAALSRNGIARLWWGAYLTRDPARENPYELTATLFLRQDIQVALLERSLGKCDRVRFAVLDFLRVNAGSLSSESFGKRIQIIVRELNLHGGVVVLDALASSEILAHLQLVAERLMSPTVPSGAAL